MSHREPVRPAPSGGLVVVEEVGAAQHWRPIQQAVLHMQHAPFTAAHATEEAASMLNPCWLVALDLFGPGFPRWYVRSIDHVA